MPMTQADGRVLNVGLIGLGEVAQVVHLPVLQSLPRLYRIAAVCDISPELVRHIGRQYNVERQYTDMLELVKQDDLDVVFVLNSDEYHADAVIAAADRKRHVLVEKPMCLTFAEADAIREARDRNGVTVMVGYMRRYAAAFAEAVKEIGGLESVAYARVRDIIGPNSYFIRPTSHTVTFADIPAEAAADRKVRAERLGAEATGLTPDSPLIGVYRFLCGLGSHDLSAMREAIGMPRAVIGAKVAQQKDALFLNAILDYGSFSVTYETGNDLQGRFDAHLEVYGSRKSVKVQYDTPYIRHLPTRMIVGETVGEVYTETIVRPTFTDPYTLELKALYDAVVHGAEIKTTPEDYVNDLKLFDMIMKALRRQEA